MPFLGRGQPACSESCELHNMTYRRYRNKDSKRYKRHIRNKSLWMKRKRVIAYAKECGITVCRKKKKWLQRMCYDLSAELCINLSGDQNAMVTQLYQLIVKGGRRYIPDQTPPWSDSDAIRRVYRDCRVRTESTGILHHVDHIIPLKGDRVSGLHIHENLQILTATENLSKSNKYITV